MKNDSVKFKKSVPRSSTNSVISEFSMDNSPVPNIHQFASFTHANSISARLSKNSMLTDDNIKLSHPKCNPKFHYIVHKIHSSHSNKTRGLMKDSDMSSFTTAIGNYSKLGNKSKFTDETHRRIELIEKFMDDNQQTSHQLHILEDHSTPKISDNRLHVDIDMDEEQDDNLNNLDEGQRLIVEKFEILLKELRIIRKAPVYFESYDGQYALNKNLQAMYSPLQNAKNGLIVNIGKYLQSIVLEQDTFRSSQICENPEKCNYSAITAPDQHFNDWIVAASESGIILSWNMTKQQVYSNYALQERTVFKVATKPTYITQNLMNIYVGTSDDKIYLLDQRMNEKYCLSLDCYGDKEYKANSYQQSPLVPELDNQFSMDSPKASDPTIEYFKETNFNKTIIEEESDSALIHSNSSQSQDGVRYIDTIDTNLLVTLQHGFIHFDIRQPNKANFSFNQYSTDPIKTMFSPNNSDNVIFADRNNHQLNVWSISQSKLIFQKDMEYSPLDMLISKETREVVTLFHKDHSSVISIYNNDNSQLKYTDQIQLENFHIIKMILDFKCETLYGLGPFSLRTWNFHNKRERDVLSTKLSKCFIKSQLE